MICVDLMSPMTPIDSLSYRLSVDQSGACCHDRWCVDNVLRMFPSYAFSPQMPGLGSETMRRNKSCGSLKLMSYNATNDAPHSQNCTLLHFVANCTAGSLLGCCRLLLCTLILLIETIILTRSRKPIVD